jgi:tetratricopeptide (TPR) repeat protein/nitrate/TMAO reductase-like tetraheme cytochrome c subunit
MSDQNRMRQLLFAAVRTGQVRFWTIAVMMIVISVVAGAYFATDYYTGLPAQINPTYVGRQSCIECHQDQADLFNGSHHDLAMDVATDDTVRAKFDGTTLEHYGVTSRMYRDGDRFMVNTEGPDGEMGDFQVKYVFGYEPLQQYMVELERPGDAAENEIGRVQVLRICWDTENENWFYLSPPDVHEKLEPDDPLHWTGITQSWNASCAECHSTDVHKNFDHDSLQYHTTFSEIDVSCEACHGPGSAHVQAASKMSLFWDRNHGMALPKLKGTSTRAQIETCAQCHSRRRKLCNGFKPGDMFQDFYSHELLGSQTYYDDGQIKDEVYVYGSFLQSRMFHQSIRCSDCHDVHSTKVKYQGNQLCTSCHQHPAGKYDSPSHHFHKANGPGSKCVDCHMPHTFYMSVDARRDHSIRVPRPDLSVKFGTPNACSQCHADVSALNTDSIKPTEDYRGAVHYQDLLTARSAGNQEIAAALKQLDQSMADAAKKWYPDSKYTDGSNHDFVTALVEARNSNDKRIQLLCDIVSRKSYPEIVRASAMLDLDGDRSQLSLDAATTAIRSDLPSLVLAGLHRIENEIAMRADIASYTAPQRGETERQFVNQLSQMFSPLEKQVRPLLANERRSIRIEAAGVYASFPSFAVPVNPDSFARASKELIDSLLLDNDRGNAHLALGSVYEMLGQVDKAKQSYETAMNVAPDTIGARANLAAILDLDVSLLQQQQASLEQNNMPKQVELTGEKISQLQKRIEQLRQREHQLIKKDLDRSSGLANTDGLHYRYAMSCYLQDQLDEAETHLLKAYEINPDVPTYLIALASFYQKKENWEKATEYAEKLIALHPAHPGYRNLLNSIKSSAENR